MISKPSDTGEGAEVKTRKRAATAKEGVVNIGHVPKRTHAQGRQIRTTLQEGGLNRGDVSQWRQV